MFGRFQIFLRKRQNTFEGANVTVQCDPVTGFAQYVPGDVDQTWYDYTDQIEFAEKLSLTWDKINSGNSSNSITNPDGSNYDKSITSELLFIDEAAQFIKDWLLASECQILNAVEVKIIDLIAGGTYRVFEIKSDNIDEAPIDEPCQLRIKLREQDNVWHAIHKTFIWDNWQHWFEDSAIKKHPCFLTCIEPRPRLLQSARMGFLIFAYSMPAISGVAQIVSNITFLISARKILNANRFVDAPLVQTYIKNVAGKCGLLTDTIFDPGQQWENLCLYYPQSGFMHESNSNTVSTLNQYFHFENRWMITIAELLDKLKIPFAAEWYVTPNNTIVFKHIKDLIDLAPIYDFTIAGAQPIYELRYSFNGDKKPAYGRYQYQTDGSDLASQEVSTLYNDIIDYDGPANNPMLEGERAKNFEFAPTGFVRDGRSHDYMDLLIDDGTLVAKILMIILTVVTAFLTLGVITAPAAIAGAAILLIWNININSRNNELQNHFINSPIYTGAVRLTSDQVLVPRLILWDGANKSRSKPVATTSLPTPNTYYNPTSAPYNVKNNISQNNPGQVVYNYPLYFDGDFKGNLFDQYHDEIDNPLKSKESHRDAKFYVDLCEDMLQLFGVFENQYAVIGKIVKIEQKDNYGVFLRIGNISVDYDSNRINIKGKILRRSA